MLKKSDIAAKEKEAAAKEAALEAKDMEETSEIMQGFLKKKGKVRKTNKAFAILKKNIIDNPATDKETLEALDYIFSSMINEIAELKKL